MNLRWAYFPIGLLAFYLLFGEGLRIHVLASSEEAIGDLVRTVADFARGVIHIVRLAVWG